MKCNFSKINSSFCGGTITLYTVCAMCSDTVHFMQFTGLAICMWFNCSKQHNNAQNHKNTGVAQAIFHKCPYIRACPYKYRRLGALDCTYNDHQDHQNTAPTWNGDLNLSKWGPNFE